MVQRSAGILVWRRREGAIEVLLVHPGGPYWRNKDRGAWQIPKGLIEPGEDAEAAAMREVEEELGVKLEGPLVPLGEIRQKGGKYVEAFALEIDLDPAAIRSNRFEIEWPPESGRIRSYPEVDSARWFGIEDAGEMMLESQKALIGRLLAR